MINNNVTYWKDGKIKIAKFDKGDFVDYEGELRVVTRIVLNPNVDCIFSYDIIPGFSGGDVPEDELEFWELD